MKQAKGLGQKVMLKTAHPGLSPGSKNLHRTDESPFIIQAGTFSSVSLPKAPAWLVKGDSSESGFSRYYQGRIMKGSRVKTE